VFGLLVSSVSLVADGFHSLSDLATDAAVLVGVYFGSKEPDHEHPYGHGRIETFSAALVALVLILIGCGMIFKASMSIARMGDSNETSKTFGAVVIGISLISVVAKEWIYRWTRNIAVKTHSAALYANAWHHRSDALSSVAVLVGAIAVLFGYPLGDPIAAIAVGLSVDKKTIEQIEKIIASEGQILGWHKLRTRSLGREIFVDFHMLVDPDLNVIEAHRIADSLEQSLHQQITQPVNVMVHVEPKIY
ncbi:MAG: cation diffusion facilitator family transporter, partial [Planctomycetota bacterium]